MFTRSGPCRLACAGVRCHQRRRQRTLSGSRGGRGDGCLASLQTLPVVIPSRHLILATTRFPSAPSSAVQWAAECQRPPGSCRAAASEFRIPRRPSRRRCARRRGRWLDAFHAGHRGGGRRHPSRTRSGSCRRGATAGTASAATVPPMRTVGAPVEHADRRGGQRCVDRATVSQRAAPRRRLRRRQRDWSRVEQGDARDLRAGPFTSSPSVSTRAHRREEQQGGGFEEPRAGDVRENRSAVRATCDTVETPPLAHRRGVRVYRAASARSTLRATSCGVLRWHGHVSAPGHMAQEVGVVKIAMTSAAV